MGLNFYNRSKSQLQPHYLVRCDCLLASPQGCQLIPAVFDRRFFLSHCSRQTFPSLICGSVTTGFNQPSNFSFNWSTPVFLSEEKH